MANPIDLTTLAAVMSHLALDSQGLPIVGVLLTAGGSGYPNSFTVTVTPVDGAGSGATITGTAVGGVIQSLTLVDGGKGYSQPPNLTFPTGTGAAAKVLLRGQVNMELAITSASLEFLREVGAAPTNGLVPTQTIFQTPQSFDDWQSGTNSETLYVRHTPVRTVTAVTIFRGSAPIILQPAADPSARGYYIHPSGKALCLRGYVWERGNNNVHLVYSAGYDSVPSDVEEGVRLAVCEELARRTRIGQSSEAMGDGGTHSYRSWNWPPKTMQVIKLYKRLVPIL